MTVPALRAVGFCAHYSPQGDWAFSYALGLSRSHSLQLNVFHFLDDPYALSPETARFLSKDERPRLAIEKERELRTYYDELAGDYLEVGFRLCENNEWTELHRCLVKREFQVLVLGYPSERALFGGRPILEFASVFVSPVVLVGPHRADEFYLNASAVLMADRLGMGGCSGEIHQPGLQIRHCSAAGI